MITVNLLANLNPIFVVVAVNVLAMSCHARLSLRSLSADALPVVNNEIRGIYLPKTLSVVTLVQCAYYADQV